MACCFFLCNSYQIKDQVGDDSFQVTHLIVDYFISDQRWSYEVPNNFTQSRAALNWLTAAGIHHWPEVFHMFLPSNWWKTCTFVESDGSFSPVSWRCQTIRLPFRFNDASSGTLAAALKAPGSHRCVLFNQYIDHWAFWWPDLTSTGFRDWKAFRLHRMTALAQIHCSKRIIGGSVTDKRALWAT